MRKNKLLPIDNSIRKVLIILLEGYLMSVINVNPRSILVQQIQDVIGYLALNFDWDEASDIMSLPKHRLEEGYNSLYGEGRYPLLPTKFKVEE